MPDRERQEYVWVLGVARSCSQARASWRRNHQISSSCRLYPMDVGSMRRMYQSSSMCEILLSSRHEEEKKSSGLFDTADDGEGGVEGNYWFLILHPGSYPVTDPRNKTLKNYRCFCILSCIRSTNCLMLVIFFVRLKRFSCVIPWYS